MNGSEDNFQELFFLFPHLDSWDQTQVIKFVVTSTFTILPAQPDLGALTPNHASPLSPLPGSSVSPQPFLSALYLTSLVSRWASVYLWFPSQI